MWADDHNTRTLTTLDGQTLTTLDNEPLKTEFRPSLLKGVTVVQARAYSLARDQKGEVVKTSVQLTPPSVDFRMPPLPYPAVVYSTCGFTGSIARVQIRPLSSMLPPLPVLIFTQLPPRFVDFHNPW